MKRIKEACICQTLHFMLKEDVGHDYAVKVVKEEITKYKASLERSRSSTTQHLSALISTDTTEYR